MRYSNQEIQSIFTYWCKCFGVKQAKPLPPIENGHFSKPYTFIVGSYTIPDGIMGWGIAQYVSNGGGIRVIMRAKSSTAFVEMMQFAILSKELKNKHS